MTPGKAVSAHQLPPWLACQMHAPTYTVALPRRYNPVVYYFTPYDRDPMRLYVHRNKLRPSHDGCVERAYELEPTPWPPCHPID